MSFDRSEFAGAIDGYDANDPFTPARQTRVAKTAPFVVWPVLQATAVGVPLRDDDSLRQCAGFNGLRRGPCIYQRRRDGDDTGTGCSRGDCQY
jgi:hypothetical protein